MRTFVDPLRSGRTPTTSITQLARAGRSKRQGKFSMLSFLTAWKTTEESDGKASAVEAASNATKAFEEHLSLLQSSSDVAEQAGKSAVEIQGSMESKKESVKQLLSELEKRNADQLNSGIGNDMSVTLAVPPSEVANTIHEMVTKSRPQGVVDRPAPVSSVSTIAEAFVPPPAPSREEEQEKQRQEEEEKQRREDEERRRREEEEERHEAERLRVDEQARAAAAEKERLAQEEQERQQQQQQQRQEAATTAAPAAPPAPADKEHRAEGSGHEIMLQAFNWLSHQGDYYGHICEMAPTFKRMGFTYVWLPPPTASVSPEGYMPTDYFNLSSRYGDEAGLRRAVAALKAEDIKVAGDCVLNHRCALHQDEHGIWNKFGGRLDWDANAICGDDSNFRGRGNKSTGDHFHAAPNVDHTQPFVREGICEWLNWLRTDIGIDGYRLDFARGFGGEFVKEYCERTGPHFVVGEYWDSLQYEHGVAAYCQNQHRQQIVNWINAAGGQATAFDVTTKGILHEVFNRQQYWRLSDPSRKPPGVMGWWPSRSTTFLENHDTGCAQAHWEFPRHGLEQGYAYILTHPGTPTVFYNHLFDEHRFAGVRQAVEALIAIRRRNGVNARSSVEIADFSDRHYAAITDHRVAMRIGEDLWHPVGHEWRVAASGDRWVVWEHSE